MSDEPTSTTAVPADVEEAAALLAELRTRVEEAAVEIDRLTAELVDRTQALDELETIMDAVLGVTDTAVVLVGEDRRVRAMSRGAADLFDTRGSQVGRPLSTVLPDDLAEAVGEGLDAAWTGEGGTGTAADGAATIRALPGGEALLVLRKA